MTKQLTLFFALTLSLNSFSQSTFVKGYFINNANEKTNCLIKNVDWLNNPTEFRYRINENSKVKTLTIDDVKEFGVLNTFKYVRHIVDIERSGKLAKELDYDKNPIFNTEQLFLKVLIEGKAILYSYEDKGLTRYFFSKKNAEVNQLVSKHYLSNVNQAKINNEFRRQLWIALKCESISMNSLKKIRYRKSDLVQFFVKYNECSKSEFVNYQKKKNKKKDLFNLTLRPGIRNSSFVLINPNEQEIDFGKNLTSFRLGLEAEFIFGFNNNKWAFLFEPTYHQFNADLQTTSFKQKRIEFNFGLRHYIYLKKKDVKLFANASFIYVNNFNNQLTERGNSISIEMQDNLNVALGIGCKYKDRFSLELRHLPSTNFILSDSSGEKLWYTRTQSLSIALGYTLF